MIASCIVQGAIRASEPVAPSVRFVSIAREGADVWLLPEEGDAIYLQRGLLAPHRAFALTVHGRPHRWANHPTGIAIVSGELWIASGSRTIEVFDIHGVERRVIVAPAAVTQIVASNQLVWVYDDLPQPATSRLYYTKDRGAVFSAVPFPTDEGASVLAKLLTTQLIFGAGTNKLFLAHMIGPPAIEEYGPSGRERSFDVAYIRTATRDALRAYRSGNSEPTEYSAPVRDLYVTTDDHVLVLRNREDIRTGARFGTEQGRRVDRYDPGRRHVATAVLPDRARFILRGTVRSVTVLTDAGAVVERPFGPPVEGRITR